MNLTADSIRTKKNDSQVPTQFNTVGVVFLFWGQIFEKSYEELMITNL